jgi:aspartyl-tRNA(Asn)/glutamyl-tRNA(Gln) amidotransferase subunit C
MIDREQVRKVAHLARLTLEPQEEESFTHQLNDILAYVEQLATLDTQDVAPTTRAIDVSNVLRSDHHAPHPARDSILAGAPDRDEDFFKVPKILGE